MPLLVKGVYGLETNSKKTPFGLLNHQYRIDGLLNNAGWFNKYGEKLGFGDVTIQDLQKISLAISKGEAFIILSEFDTSWNIPSTLDSSAPGPDYIMQNCLWYILSGAIYRVRGDNAAEALIKDGVKYTRISRPEFYNLTGYNVKKIPEPVARPVKTKTKISKDDEEFEHLLKKVNSILKTKSPQPATPAKTAQKTATLPAVGSGKYIGYAPVKTVRTTKTKTKPAP